MSSSRLQDQVRFGGGGSSLHSGIEFGQSRSGRSPVRGVRGVFGGEEDGGGVRSGPGAARTILLFRARPSKQPRLVRTFLKGTHAA
jgi:hypothetical protein